MLRNLLFHGQQWLFAIVDDRDEEIYNDLQVYLKLRKFDDDMSGIHMIYNLRRRGKFFQKPFATGFGLQFFVLVKLYAVCSLSG